MRLSEFQTYLLYFMILLLSYILPEIDDHVSFKVTKTKKIHHLFTVMLFVLMFLMLMYRSCGIDTSTYEFTFVHNRSELDYDILFFGLLQIVRNYTSNPVIWLGVMGALTLVALFFACDNLKEYVDRKTFSLYTVLYIYFFAFNYARMILSVAILVLAISFLVKEKYLVFIILNIIAGLIHYTSFSILLVFLIYYIGKNHRYFLIGLGLITVIVVLINPGFISYLVISSHYAVYFDDYFEANIGNIGIGTLFQIFPYTVMLFIFSKSCEKRIVTMLYLFLICNIAAGLFGYMIPVASRIARFTLAFPCIFIPAYIIKQMEQNNSFNKKIFSLITLVIAIVVYFIFIQPSFKGIGIIPYSSV